MVTLRVAPFIGMDRLWHVGDGTMAYIDALDDAQLRMDSAAGRETEQQLAPVFVALEQLCR